VCVERNTLCGTTGVVCLSGKKTFSERDRDRETDRERARETEREAERGRERDRERERERNRWLTVASVHPLLTLKIRAVWDTDPLCEPIPLVHLEPL